MQLNQWNNWLQWTVCSRTCGAGVQSRVRTCPGPVGSCPGLNEENRACTRAVCGVAHFIIFIAFVFVSLTQ